MAPPKLGEVINYSYGFIPSGLFQQVRDALVAAAIGRPVSRDD